MVSDSGDLAIKPADLLTSYARGLAAKQPDPPYDSDTFAEQVLSRAEAAKTAVAAQADFTQSFLSLIHI